MKRRARGRGTIGVALAGGGPVGAVYEIGALRALEEVLEGVDLTDLHVYVGVSAGSLIAALLSNGITPAQMCRAIARHDQKVHPFSPKVFFTPAAGAWLRGGIRLPELLVRAVAAYAGDPDELTLTDSMARLGRALPLGLFDNGPIREWLGKVLAHEGRTDDFRELGRRLIVVAADVDSGTAVRFGEPGRDHVPISQAVQASTALPVIYPPVRIEGRYYADGVLLKTLHASVALDAGAELLFCINPIVPLDTRYAAETGLMPGEHLAEIGLPAVLSQTFRTLIHSRLQLGFEAYRTRYPGADALLIEPGRDDSAMFFTNIFSFSSRIRVLEHAWRSTRSWMRRRRPELERILARHGVGLKRSVLEDDDREFWTELILDRVPEGLSVTDRLGRLLAQAEALARRSAPGAAPRRARRRKRASAGGGAR